MMGPMRYGIMFANTVGFTTPEGARELASAAEDNGIESLWAVEHVVVPSGYQSEYPYAKDGKMPGGEALPIPDPLVWLSFVAAASTTLKLATGVAIIPQRNPIYTAKEVASVDRISGGRFLWTPASKRGWGALHLTTTGRRSGRERKVIIGYLQDEVLITSAEARRLQSPLWCGVGVAAPPEGDGPDCPVGSAKSAAARLAAPAPDPDPASTRPTRSGVMRDRRARRKAAISRRRSSLSTGRHR